ncbi:MAG: hypothetical protein HY080_14130 [Gammaproteobacteria bacterium]|nr:hypothetical protein [Gammaproteobacteria bacterium]
MFGRNKSHNTRSSLVGICLTEQGLALAVVEHHPDQPAQVRHLAYSECASIQAISSALVGWVNEFKLKGDSANFVLGAHMYSLILTEAPEVKPEELSAAMRWKVKDLIQFDISEAAVDVFGVPGQKSRGRTPMAYVVCAAKDVLRAYIQVLTGSQLNLLAIDIPAMVQRNIASLLAEDKQGVAFVVLAERHGAINLCRDGELYLSRDLEVGWRHFEVSAASTQPGLGLDEDLSPANTRHLDAIILEVQRSLDYYESHFAQPPIKNLVLAPLPFNLNGMMDYLARNTGLMVRELDLNPLLGGIQRMERGLQAQCLAAIGAALRLPLAA